MSSVSSSLTPRNKVLESERSSETSRGTNECNSGHTDHPSIKLKSRSPTAVHVSWVEKGPAVGQSYTVRLFQPELSAYELLGLDTTTHRHYSFTDVDSCSPYVVCVDMVGSQSLTCLSTLTDPDIPKDFEVTSWNSTSISLAWNSPYNHRFSMFLLTVFYLNGTDHITENVSVWHQDDDLVFTLSDLQPCTRVKFGLQTVCQAGAETGFSKMVLNDGNSVHSNIEALHQTSFGPDNYTLSWKVRNTSSISTFRVYHEGVLQCTILTTSYTVGRLLPCHRYQARVEALCGDGILMNAKTITVHTGPHGVSQLRYDSSDSTAYWRPGTSNPPAVAFLYELSHEKGPVIQSSRVTGAELHLPGLEEGKNYILDVWEECDGLWESEHSKLFLEGGNTSIELMVRAAGTAQDPDVDLYTAGLRLVVPWSLPEELLNGESEPQAEMVKFVTHKLKDLLEDFKPTRIKLAGIEPADDPGKTEFLFSSFDATIMDEDVPLSVPAQLNYIQSLNAPNITVTDGAIHWEGPDLCASEQISCPLNALCINTLGSYICVCHHGYYDVSSVMKHPVPSHPVCNEKGLFSECRDKLIKGGIAKSYLTSRMGGKVNVKLNDGRCKVEETEMFYQFNTPRNPHKCGTQRQVNNSCIQFQNTMTVTLTKGPNVTRGELKFIWKCVYSRHYVRNAQIGVNAEWISSSSVVEFNSSLQLSLTMTLYSDDSYNQSYSGPVSLGPDDTLFFQLAFETTSAFTSDVLLQLDSCWATETPNPQDEVKGVFLQNGCPVDNMFQWLSVNGREQRSRFSILMFKMPQNQPLFFHCLANICGHEEDCTKNCSSQRRVKRLAGLMEGRGKRAAVVSAGPLVVNMKVNSGTQPSNWEEHRMVIFAVAGTIGVLGFTLLLLTAMKAVMSYYEGLRPQ
ncbi:uromodulin-like 1 [Sphaeramia orbicularis]|uniref:uromodulin-like 1 n=1 Tax=Sphaeramia orbicularis TaxID=375764 RepID=UPI00117E9704|nr:uromodulin-like 1 [Sphaeramia orbicularis]